MAEFIPITELDVEAAERFPQQLHKELWGRPDALETSLYRWWWECLMAALQFPDIDQEIAGDHDDIAATIEKVREDFQLDPKEDFQGWWGRVGNALFREESVPVVEVYATRDRNCPVAQKFGLLLRVPLTINREIILEQINVALDYYHSGKDLRRHEHSTAKHKIYPNGRYRLTPTDYKHLIDFWTTQRRNAAQPKELQKSMWEIFHKATGKKTINKDNPSRNKIASANYSKADLLIKNAILGRFPSTDEIK